MASEYLLPYEIAWYAINVWVMVRFIISLRQGATYNVNRQNKSNTASMGVNIFITRDRRLARSSTDLQAVGGSPLPLRLEDEQRHGRHS